MIDSLVLSVNEKGIGDLQLGKPIAEFHYLRPVDLTDKNVEANELFSYHEYTLEGSIEAAGPYQRVILAFQNDTIAGVFVFFDTAEHFDSLTSNINRQLGLVSGGYEFGQNELYHRKVWTWGKYPGPSIWLDHDMQNNVMSLSILVKNREAYPAITYYKPRRITFSTIDRNIQL